MNGTNFIDYQLSSEKGFAEIEFEHFDNELGYVDVEAIFEIQTPDFYSKESDVDYNGLQELVDCVAYKGGSEVSVDIPMNVLYHHLRAYLRNLELEGCFEREGF